MLRRKLLPGAFEYALSYLIDNEIDLGRFAARFKNDKAGAPTYVLNRDGQGVLSWRDR